GGRSAGTAHQARTAAHVAALTGCAHFLARQAEMAISRATPERAAERAASFSATSHTLGPAQKPRHYSGTRKKYVSRRFAASGGPVQLVNTPTMPTPSSTRRAPPRACGRNSGRLFA